jgi:16S rRNA pseudouridine516 synthase
MRLDKYLSNSGVGSRNAVKNLIRKGFVFVNSELIKKADIDINPDIDIVHVEDQLITYKEFVYLLLNKPSGFLSATEDPKDKTVMELISDHTHRDLHIVGRLDKYTTGLLLITDDGKFTHQVTSPRYHIEKTYDVIVDKPLDPSLVESFSRGVVLEDGYKTLPSKLTIHTPTQATLVIHEGKFHQVKRMFEVFGAKVLTLNRSRFGSLTLAGVEVGAYRELTTEEVASLKTINN